MKDLNFKIGDFISEPICYSNGIKTIYINKIIGEIYAPFTWKSLKVEVVCNQKIKESLILTFNGFWQFQANETRKRASNINEIFVFKLNTKYGKIKL